MQANECIFGLHCRLLASARSVWATCTVQFLDHVLHDCILHNEEEMGQQMLPTALPLLMYARNGKVGKSKIETGTGLVRAQSHLTTS